MTEDCDEKKAEDRDPVDTVCADREEQEAAGVRGVCRQRHLDAHLDSRFCYESRVWIHVFRDLLVNHKFY